jgi:hypothetical protein
MSKLLLKVLISFLTVLSSISSHAEIRQDNPDGSLRIYDRPIPKGTSLMMTICCDERIYLDIATPKKTGPTIEESHGNIFSQVIYASRGTKFSFRDSEGTLNYYQCNPTSYGKCDTAQSGKAMVRMTALDLVVRCTTEPPVNKMWEPNGEVHLSLETGSVEPQDLLQKLSCNPKKQASKKSKQNASSMDDQ